MAGGFGGQLFCKPVYDLPGRAGGESTSYNTRDFNIQVSTDNINWTTVVNVSGNTANITTNTIAATNARYIKLTVTAPEQSSGGAARIYEVQVFGN